MLKLLITFKRNPHLTEKQCDEHYRTVHTELAKKAMGQIPGFRRYVQNKVIRHIVYDYNDWTAPKERMPDFDGFVELYADDKVAMEKAFSTPEMQACFDDHRNFMDVNIPASLRIYEVIEKIPLEKGTNEGAATAKFLFSWKRNPHLTEKQYEQHYCTVHTELGKKALEAIPGFQRYVQHKVVRYMVCICNDWKKLQEAKTDIDRFVTIYFNDREAMQTSFDPPTPGLKACFDDHKNFMDVGTPENLKVYEVIERVPLGK